MSDVLVAADKPVDLQFLLDTLRSTRRGGRVVDALIHDTLGVARAHPLSWTTHAEDAALLIQAVLPGWKVEITGEPTVNPITLEREGDLPFYVSLRRPVGTLWLGVMPPVTGPTLALTMCIALVTACLAEVTGQA